MSFVGFSCREVIHILTSIKDRSLEIGQKVDVYRNLNNKCFSVKDKKSGLVVAHADGISITNCKCRVSEKSRQRVINQQRRTVHAWITGHFNGEDWMDTSDMVEVYYNPFKLDSFVNKETGKKLDEIDFVYFVEGKAYISSH